MMDLNEIYAIYKVYTKMNLFSIKTLFLLQLLIFSENELIEIVKNFVLQ